MTGRPFGVDSVSTQMTRLASGQQDKEAEGERSEQGSREAYTAPLAQSEEPAAETSDLTNHQDDDEEKDQV